MRVVGWATFCVEGKNFSFDAPKRKATRKAMALQPQCADDGEERLYKDRSFAVEEVGGDPPTWEDEDEVNQVDGQR